MTLMQDPTQSRSEVHLRKASRPAQILRGLKSPQAQENPQLHTYVP